MRDAIFNFNLTPSSCLASKWIKTSIGFFFYFHTSETIVPKRGLWINMWIKDVAIRSGLAVDNTSLADSQSI